MKVDVNRVQPAHHSHKATGKSKLVAPIHTPRRLLQTRARPRPGAE